MEVSDHIQHMPSGKVALSPLAILVITIGAPFVKDFVADRLNSGNTSSVQTTKIDTLEGQLKELKEDRKESVTKDQFTMFANDVKTQLDTQKEWLRIIGQRVNALPTVVQTTK